MTQETKQAEFVEFEIVQESEQVVRAASPWRLLRFIVMGLTGVALFSIMLAFGVLLMVPLLIFLVITRIMSTLSSAGART